MNSHDAGAVSKVKRNITISEIRHRFFFHLLLREYSVVFNFSLSFDAGSALPEDVFPHSRNLSMFRCIYKVFRVVWNYFVIILLENAPRVTKIPKYNIFIIKNYLVVVTVMAYGRVLTVHTLEALHCLLKYIFGWWKPRASWHWATLKGLFYA